MDFFLFGALLVVVVVILYFSGFIDWIQEYRDHQHSRSRTPELFKAAGSGDRYRSPKDPGMPYWDFEFILFQLIYFGRVDCRKSAKNKTVFVVDGNNLRLQSTLNLGLLCLKEYGELYQIAQRQTQQGSYRRFRRTIGFLNQRRKDLLATTAELKLCVPQFVLKQGGFNAVSLYWGPMEVVEFHEALIHRSQKPES
jgi:hypothetical protein